MLTWNCCDVNKKWRYWNADIFIWILSGGFFWILLCDWKYYVHNSDIYLLTYKGFTMLICELWKHENWLYYKLKEENKWIKWPKLNIRLLNEKKTVLIYLFKCHRVHYWEYVYFHFFVFFCFLWKIKFWIWCFISSSFHVKESLQLQKSRYKDMIMI